MKKILSFLLILAVLLGLTGCHTSTIPDHSQVADLWTESTSTQSETTETPATDSITEPTVSEKPDLKPVQTKPTGTKPTQPEETQPIETQPPLEPTDTQPPLEPPETEAIIPPTEPAPQKSYTRKDEVAQYIHEHGCLPDNFITKSEAKALGWRSGSLEKYAPGKCIGGDRFYNREGLLPSGHTYYECDIDTLGKSSRGAKRIVFSSDGLIYYTSDHYRSFTLLYGEP